jgi:(heptosyl)LPS beta-1,4-glucosyltransferase
MKPGISAIIVAHNQVELLSKCLDSVKSWVDQIVVIDLSNNQEIKDLAKSVKAKYIIHPYVPVVEEVRQESIKYAEHEYIVLLDPDEQVSPSLAKDLLAKIKSGNYDFFTTPRQNIVFGKWLRHSRWWPDFQTRVFRVGSTTWGESLHSEVVANGHGYTYDQLEEFALIHQNYQNLDEWLSKNMRYAKVDAQDRLKGNKDFTLIKAIKLSVSELISRFFASSGYLDGMHGLVLSLLQSFYYFMVYAYYWEAKRYADLESSSVIKSFPRTWFSHALSEVMFWDKARSPLHVIKEKLVRKMIA